MVRWRRFTRTPGEKLDEEGEMQRKVSHLGTAESKCRVEEEKRMSQRKLVAWWVFRWINEWVMKWKERKNGSWTGPYFKLLSGCWGRHYRSQDSWSPGRGLNLGPPEYERNSGNAYNFRLWLPVTPAEVRTRWISNMSVLLLDPPAPYFSLYVSLFLLRPMRCRLVFRALLVWCSLLVLWPLHS